MAISFGESLNTNNETTEEVFEMAPAYADVWYPEYVDDNVQSININKVVTLSPNQPNLTQETHSQLIPFEMPRYYDGIDLSKMIIQIHFVNANNQEYFVPPINVMTSETKLRFGWLIDERVTAYVGKIFFEIYISGVNSYGMEYLWKSRVNQSLKVEESLYGNGFIEPADFNDWYKSFEMAVNYQLQHMQEINANASLAADRAEAAVAPITEAASQVQSLSERIDQIVALTDGSTTGDAELLDARIGYDGTTYNSAGAAIRAQIYALKQEIDSITARYNALTNTLELNLNG